MCRTAECVKRYSATRNPHCIMMKVSGLFPTDIFRCYPLGQSGTHHVPLNNQKAVLPGASLVSLSFPTLARCPAELWCGSPSRTSKALRPAELCCRIVEYRRESCNVRLRTGTWSSSVLGAARSATHGSVSNKVVLSVLGIGMRGRF